MKKSKEDNATLGIISLLLLTIIVILCLIFYYREFLFGVRLTQDSSPESWLSAGFGYYSDSSTSPCVSTDGKCSSKATQVISRTCKRNPITGKGCLIDGKQYFKSFFRSVPCINQCYISDWNKTYGNDCELDYDTCILSGALGKRRNTYTCVEIDGIGFNGCTIIVPDSTEINGCKIDSNLLAICEVGAVVTVEEPCLTSDPICGQWRAEGKECLTSINFTPSPQDVDCLSFIDGNKLNSIRDIFKLGYYEQDLDCVNDNVEGEVKCKTVPCKKSSNAISDGIKDLEGSIFSCINTTTPSCVKTCIYYNPDDILDIPNTKYASWDFLLKNPCFIVAGRVLEFELTLNNIPCNKISRDALIKGAPITPSSTLEKKLDFSIGMPPLSDGFGDSTKSLHSSYFLAYDPKFISDSTGNMSMPDCSEDQIRHSTSTIFIFRPNDISSTGDKLLCNIIAIQAEGYIGVMYVEGKSLAWRKINPVDLMGVNNIDAVFTLSRNTHENFSISDSNGVEVNIISNDSPNGMSLSNCNIKPINKELVISDIEGNKTTFDPLKNIPGDDEILPNFHTFLSYRATRRNPYSCNALYSYPPPGDYTPYDVGIPSYKKEDGNPFWFSSHP